MKGTEAIELPTASELKTAIKIIKADYKGRNMKIPFTAVYKITTVDFDVYVNAQYLLDMIEALPNATCKTGKKAIAPLYFENSDGDGILLPIRYCDDLKTQFPIVNDFIVEGNAA